jgi:hypothetical protein
MMTLEEHEIYKQLKSTPGSIYIAPGNHQLYTLCEVGMVSIYAKTDLSLLTDDELNKFIQDYLLKNM